MTMLVISRLIYNPEIGQVGTEHVREERYVTTLRYNTNYTTLQPVNKVDTGAARLWCLYTASPTYTGAQKRNKF
jgi:hypothetical protein